MDNVRLRRLFGAGFGVGGLGDWGRWIGGLGEVV